MPPRWWSGLVDRIRGRWALWLGVGRGTSRAERLDDEVAFHLEMATERNIRAGMEPAEARRLAVAAFGGRDRWREEARDEYRSRPLHEMIGDVRYAVRGLRRSPAFTAAAVTTLALSVGACTAIFSVVNAVLLRGLPYPEADRIALLCERNRTDPPTHCNVLNASNFLSWRDAARSFDAMGAFVERRVTISAVGGEREPVSVQARIANAAVFSILGARPEVGRLFTDAEDREGGPDVIVLGYDFWRTHFGSDSNVVGKVVLLQSYEYRVIGVASAKTALYQPVDVWIPVRFTAASRSSPGRSWRAIARLRPGVTFADADAELRVLARQRELATPALNANWSAHSVPLRESLVGGARRGLWLLLGAVGFLLAIACANVANLLLARSADRDREIAIRISMGASPGRIVRQLLTESVVLSLVASAIGFVVAARGTGALVALMPSGLSAQELNAVSVDWRVALFATAVALLTGVLFGLVPARQATRASVQQTLRSGGRGTSGASRASARLRSALVVAEMSLALVLLAGAGLMSRTLAALRDVELGFEPANVLTGNLTLPRRRYANDTVLRAFYQNAEARIASIPGVTAVGAISYLPLSGQRSANGFNVEGRAPAPPGQEPTGDMRAVTPGYFDAMGIRIIEGRAITAEDRAGAPAVAVVSETLARTFWPGESAVGHYLLYEWQGNERVRIVGVAGDVHHESLDRAAFMEIYRPFEQFVYAGMTLVVRGSADPAALVLPVRTAIRELDTNVPFADARPMADLVTRSLGRTRLSTSLFALFAILGVTLAAVGIYGVMSYSVQQRRREIGIRLALGATPGAVVGMVVRHGASLAALGVVIGIPAALGLSRLMVGLLFGVTASDGVTFVVTALLLATVGVVAAYLPGRRATTVDPAIVLRGE